MGHAALRNGWHTVREDGRLVLARHWPPRFDVAAQAGFPPALWRCLRTLRGFSPVIEVTATETGLILRAGGRALAPVAPDTEARIAALLASPGHRARWLAHARERAA